MLQVNPQPIHTAGRFYNESVQGWGQALVPTGLWERTTGMTGAAWERSVSKGLYDWFQLKEDAGDAITQNPRLAEVLTPEQIAREYPHTEAPIKTPKTRAEIELIQARDVEFRELVRAISGENTSFIPDAATEVVGGFAGFLGDPLTWATGVAAFSFAPLVPCLLYTSPSPRD